MAHARLLFGRWFRRANIQPAINLHRIGGDDFSSKSFRETQGYLGFADGSRANDQERAKRHGH